MQSIGGFSHVPYNLDILDQCSNQLSYLAVAKYKYFQSINSPGLGTILKYFVQQASIHEMPFHSS